MRILIANKFWYQRGGLERVMLDEAEWLAGAGHEIAHFSTSHPKNDDSPWSDYFVRYRELGADGQLGVVEKGVAAVSMFYNREAARGFGRLLRDFRPDVVHVHGIHRQISPSILGVAARAGVPVIQSLHDYHHLCPGNVLLYGGAEVCAPRRCGVFWYGGCIRGRCVQGSLPASTVAAVETAWQRLTRAYERGITRFISPSVFVAGQMRLGGWTQPIDVVPNAVAAGSTDSAPSEGFCIIGRLSPEKGIGVALEAANRARVRVTVAGEGPAGERLRRDFPEADFVGHLDDVSVAKLVAQSSAVIVPSIWFENAPMSVLEAMASGTPVIASAIGGIPEQLTHDVDGLLVAPGDVTELAQAMSRIVGEPMLADRLGSSARETVAARFSPERHLNGLLDVYHATLDRS